MWEKICRQKLPKKLFKQVWENSRKILSTPKNLPALKPMNVHLRPRLKGQRGKCPRFASFSGVPVHIVLHVLSFLVVVGYCVTVMNILVNYQRSLETEQFKSAKISCNALKQGSSTHSMLRQRSS